MSPMRRPRLSALLSAVALVLTSCEAEEQPVGPPRCEPEGELVLERQLKEGYRALLDGDTAGARKHFDAVLALADGHPEARAGLRALTRPQETATAGPTGYYILLAGERVTVDLPINSERHRFEERAARRATRKRLEMPLSKAETWFRQRRLHGTGEPLAVDDRAAIVNAIDVVVLHDTHTSSVRDAFVAADDTGRSTHFMIDYDGTVYQTLDIAYEAAHSAESVDARSISVHLTNPVDLDVAPLPPEGKDRFERVAATAVVRHGQPVQTWGYTDEQQLALQKLLRTLVKLLPAIPREIPRGKDGAVAQVELREVGLPATGIIGHYHLWRMRYDPAPGLDWEAIGRAIAPARQGDGLRPAAPPPTRSTRGS